MYLTIVLRKEVPDTETAQTLTDIVRDKLSEHPEVRITSSVSEEINPTPPPE